MTNNIVFLNKVFLYFIPIVLVFVVFLKFFENKKNSKNSIVVDKLKKIYRHNSLVYYIKMFIFLVIFTVYFVLLANPNITNTKKTIEKNWIDIVLALDVSKSMDAVDLKPNRIKSAQNVLSKFIKKINSDRVGLIIFAWKPFSSIPLTFDYNIITETLKWINTDILNQNIPWMDWTAVWDALLMANNILEKWEKTIKKWAKNRKKIIILLTDWDTNRWISPLAVAKSLSWKVKIYTIWIWSKQWWKIPYRIWSFIHYQTIPPLNESDLKIISKLTNWKFFRATDNKTLENIFNEINQIEKTKIKIKVQKEYKDMYSVFVVILSVLLLSYIYLNVKFLEV